jgi:hypothetical protein
MPIQNSKRIAVMFSRQFKKIRHKFTQDPLHREAMRLQLEREKLESYKAQESVLEDMYGVDVLAKAQHNLAEKRDARSLAMQKLVGQVWPVVSVGGQFIVYLSLLVSLLKPTLFAANQLSNLFVFEVDRFSTVLIQIIELRTHQQTDEMFTNRLPSVQYSKVTIGSVDIFISGVLKKVWEIIALPMLFFMSFKFSSWGFYRSSKDVER